MKSIARALLLLALLTVQLAGGGLVQYSSYAGLIQRIFDGFVDMETVLSKGNLGIGTTDQLHGELLIIDGIAYRVTFDGEVEFVGKEETTPYVTLAQVDMDEAIVVDLPVGTTVNELDMAISSAIGNQFQKNFPYAIRIEGPMQSARLRSIPKLEKPYISLAEVAANQSIFEFENHPFTIIGFWNPPYAEELNPPKWHVHGLDHARKAGGHVLAFESGEGAKAYLWKLTSMTVHLPDTEDFADADFTADLSDIVNKVNRDK